MFYQLMIHIGIVNLIRIQKIKCISLKSYGALPFKTQQLLKLDNNLGSYN